MTEVRGKAWPVGADRDIHWPAGLTPAEADTFLHGEIVVQAPPDEVFQHLLAVTCWPRWCPAVGRVVVVGELRPGWLFQVEIFGRWLDAAVGEVVRPVRFGWAGTTLDMELYHSCLLVPAPPGTRVISELVTRGPTAKAGNAHQSAVVRTGHREWLDGLRAAVEKDPGVTTFTEADSSISAP